MPLGSSGLLWAPLGSSWLLWAPLGSPGLPWAPLGSPGFPWAPPGSPGLPWVPSGLVFGLCFCAPELRSPTLRLDLGAAWFERSRRPSSRFQSWKPFRGGACEMRSPLLWLVLKGHGGQFERPLSQIRAAHPNSTGIWILRRRPRAAKSDANVGRSILQKNEKILHRIRFPILR